MQTSDVPTRSALRTALDAAVHGNAPAAVRAVFGLLEAGFAAFDVLLAFRRVLDATAGLADTRKIEAMQVARARGIPSEHTQPTRCAQAFMETHARILGGLSGRVQLAALCARLCVILGGVRAVE